ncbi:MAG: carbohydrate ABC transporter permease [Spirochaetales bacterium]
MSTLTVHKPLERAGAYILLSIFAFLMLAPLFWALLTALKPVGAVFDDPFGLSVDTWSLKSFTDVFKTTPFHIYMFNTLKITFFSVIGVVATSALAGYAFARLKFPGRDFLFMLLLATMMIPRQVTLVPTFILMKEFGLIDDHLSLILPGAISVFGMFLMRQFFITVPIDYEEAAKIDGAGVLRRFFQVILPFAGSTIATLVLLQVMAVWNDFLYPMVFLNSELNRTLTLGLAILRGDMDTQWNMLMAAVVISNLPILVAFLITQKFVIKGIATTGLKG